MQASLTFCNSVSAIITLHTKTEKKILKKREIKTIPVPGNNAKNLIGAELALENVCFMKSMKLCVCARVR